MNTNIKQTRASHRGYTLDTYICADCGKSTKSTLKVYRGGFTDYNVTLVHRNGTGCHKGQTASEVRAMVYA